MLNFSLLRHTFTVHIAKYLTLKESKKTYLVMLREKNTPKKLKL